MVKRYRIGLVSVLVLMGLCMASPALPDSKTLTPDSGKWQVDINAPEAVVVIEGMVAPFSMVQYSVTFLNQEGGTTESDLPVIINVLFMKKATIRLSQKGRQVQHLIFQCTRGEVKIDASPGYGSNQ